MTVNVNKVILVTLLDGTMLLFPIHGVLCSACQWHTSVIKLARTAVLGGVVPNPLRGSNLGRRFGGSSLFHGNIVGYGLEVDAVNIMVRADYAQYTRRVQCLLARSFSTVFLTTCETARRSDNS